MNQLPRAARFYVSSVIVIGFALMMVCLPYATFRQPVLFLALLGLSSMTAALKVYLPLTTSGSMSVSTPWISRRCSCSGRMKRCWSRPAARSASVI
jgi:hypothetical protein